jgi:hypothetical protein
MSLGGTGPQQWEGMVVVGSGEDWSKCRITGLSWSCLQTVQKVLTRVPGSHVTVSQGGPQPWNLLYEKKYVNENKRQTRERDRIQDGGSPLHGFQNTLKSPNCVQYFVYVI